MRHVLLVSLSLVLSLAWIACGTETEPPPAVIPDAGNVIVGDAGAKDDAGERGDAGEDDAGTPDAGEDDAGTPDAGEPDAGTPDAGPEACAPEPKDSQCDECGKGVCCVDLAACRTDVRCRQF